MARTILAVLVAVLLAPTSLALGQGLDPLHDLTQLPETPVAPAADDVLRGDVVTSVTATANDLLTCQKAVELELPWWGGDIVRTEEHGLEGLLPLLRTVDQVPVQVPVYETRTTTVWEPASALGGLLGGLLAPVLEPVTKEVTVLAGYETVLQDIQEPVDFAVDLRWDQHLVEWTGYTDIVYVNLLVGAPLAASGEGTLTQVCDGEEILGYIPDANTRGHDVYALLNPGAAKTWLTDLLSVDVRIATPTDQQALDPVHGNGWLLAPRDLTTQARGEAVGLPLLPEQVAAQRDAADGQSHDAIGTQAGEATVHVPASTGLAGVVGALGAVAAGAFGVLRWPRR
ncbi:MAG: hypothetical protein ACPGQL_05840 [Thermoplasmatota archaeon]